MGRHYINFNKEERKRENGTEHLGFILIGW
jgi:hypothetical protein